MDLKQALSKLNHQDDSHWTSDGLPRIDILAELTGDKELTRKAVTEASPQLTRESFAEALEEEVSDVLSRSMNEVLRSEELTREALEALSTKAEAKLREKKGIEDELRQLWAKVQVCERNLIAFSRANKNRGNSGVKDYLERQRKNRERRAARAQEFIDSGTTAKDVIDVINSKSKLDQAMNQRGSKNPRPPARALS